MMTDIDDDICHSFLSSFADDTRLSKAVKGVTDVTKLQQDLNSIYEWAEQCNMQFNDSKFELLRYGKDSALTSCTSYLTNNGTIIDEKDFVKDLGITISNTGCFTKHISNIISKVRDLSGWITRTFNSRSRNVMLALWKALVIPRLEYCSQLWCPNKVGLIQQLELLQRIYIRKISGIGSLSYHEQLKILKLYSLERRRERYRIIYVWSILEKLVPNPNDSIVAFDHIRHGRKCNVPVVKRSAYQALRMTSLPIQGAKLFNAMPINIRNLRNCSKNMFKAKLDKYLASVPGEPQIPGYTSCRMADSNSLIDMVISAESGDMVKSAESGGKRRGSILDV